MERQDLFLYRDDGAHPLSYRQARRSLKRALAGTPFQLHAIDSAGVIKGGWKATAAALVIGGGRDTGYHNKLCGEGNRQIAEYVRGGGSYLGFCAGAYYATAYVDFDRDGELEVCQARELGFFPDAGVGPAHIDPPFVYNSEEGACASAIEWMGPEAIDKLKVYFNGGCYFRDAEKHRDVEVLARYAAIEGSPAAAVECRVGEGVAVLCGVHPEFSCNAIADLRDALEPSEERRWELFQALLRRCL